MGKLVFGWSYGTCKHGSELHTSHASSLSISPIASNRVNRETCYGLYVDMQF